MKTPSTLAFVLLAFVMIAAAPAPTEIAPEPPEQALADLTPADLTGIGGPAPLPQFQINPCFALCIEIREECDAGCSTTQCHRECRDSAIECMSHC